MIGLNGEDMTEIDLNVAQASHDLTIMGLFWAADPLVKFVMLLLVGASIWCWAIIVDKIVSLRRETRRSEEFDSSFGLVARLTGFMMRQGLILIMRRRVFVAAMREWRRASAKGLTSSGRADLKASLWLTALTDP